MSMEEVRRRAQEFSESSRQKARLAIVLGVALSGFFAWSSFQAPNATLRLGWGVLSMWGLYSAVQGYRWFWPMRSVPDVMAATSLSFYRHELERRRDYEKHVWRRSGLPFCFLGLAIVLVPPLSKEFTVNALPFFLLLVVWCVAFVLQRKRTRDKLQREIDDLNAMAG